MEEDAQYFNYYKWKESVINKGRLVRNKDKAVQESLVVDSKSAEPRID